MGRQILKALPDVVEARIGPEQGKMRRPDMSGDKHGAGTGFQCDFEQIPAVQAQDGTCLLYTSDAADEL